MLYNHFSLAFITLPSFPVLIGFEELIRLLVYSGFNARQRDNYGQTVLHLACISGNLTVVRELCEQVIYHLIVHICTVD